MEFAHLWHCLPNWPLSCLVPLIQFQYQFSPCPRCCAPPPAVLTTSSWWLPACLPGWLTDWLTCRPPWLARSPAPWLWGPVASSSLRLECSESESRVSLPVGCLILIIETLCELSALALRKPLHAYITSTRYDNNSHSHSHSNRICISYSYSYSYSHCGYELQSFLLSVPFCCASLLPIVVTLCSPLHSPRLCPTPPSVLFVVFAVLHIQFITTNLNVSLCVRHFYGVCQCHSGCRCWKACIVRNFVI